MNKPLSALQKADKKYPLDAEGCFKRDGEGVSQYFEANF